MVKVRPRLAGEVNFINKISGDGVGTARARLGWIGFGILPARLSWDVGGFCLFFQ